jgi:hypothetical protein
MATWKNKKKTFPATADVAMADITLADEALEGEGIMTNKKK